MRLSRLVVLVALVSAVLAPAAASAQEARMPRNSFLLEFRVGGAAPISFGALTLGGGFTAVPSLLAGVRLVDRFHLGLGFSFMRLDNTGGGGIGGGADLNIVTFAPTFAVDLIKSHDNRVAMYLKAGLPVGPIITCPNGTGPCDNGFAVGFDLALGGRYAVHRMLSLGIEAGASGSFINPQRNSNTGVVSFYGALVGTFYAAR
jgi:hypothetical protein